jgi:hypothetical protein
MGRYSEALQHVRRGKALLRGTHLQCASRARLL